MSEIEQIFVVSTYAESLVIEARLSQQEIPYLLHPFNDPAFGSFWRKQEGWGVLLAPAEYRSAILETCADLRHDREPREQE